MPRKKRRDRQLVRVYKRRTVVNVEALDRFLREFQPEWVGILTELAELASELASREDLARWDLSQGTLSLRIARPTFCGTCLVPSTRRCHSGRNRRLP